MDLWEGELVAELDPEDYYDFQEHRPRVRLDEGLTRSLSWPATRLYACRLPEHTHDVLILRAIEPSLRWRTYCREVLDLARALGTELVVTLGALLTDTPHTVPVGVSGTASDPELIQRFALSPSRYEGPTGILGVLQDACVRDGMAAISFWGAVPHYVAQPPSPRTTVALLRRLEGVLGLTVDLGELPEQVREWEQEVATVMAADEDIRDYVAGLEGQHNEQLEEHPDASGEAIAREFEQFLRRQDDSGGPSPSGER